MGRQLDLPLGRKLQPDERVVLDRLRGLGEERMDCYQFGTVPSRAEVKRLMTPLPRITAYD